MELARPEAATEVRGSEFNRGDAENAEKARRGRALLTSGAEARRKAWVESGDRSEAVGFKRFEGAENAEEHKGIVGCPEMQKGKRFPEISSRLAMKFNVSRADRAEEIAAVIGKPLPHGHGSD
jgi:hypothetical protein